MSILKTLTVNGVKYSVTPVIPATSVTLLASAWESDEDGYSQVVTIPDVTAHTLVDFQLTKEQAVEFHSKDLAFFAENDGGTITVHAVGDKPESDHTLQITKTEVNATGKIRGNMVGTTIKPEKVLVKATDLTLEEQAQARKNFGAAMATNYGICIESVAGDIEIDAGYETDDAGRTHSYLSFLGDNDGTVRLARVADGVEDWDAATVGQVKEMIKNGPVHYLQSTIDNPVSIRSLPGGAYLLKGVFAFYEGGTTVGFSTERYILIDKYDDRSEMQCFIPNGNKVNYVVITDTGYEAKTIFLSELESIGNRVTTIDEASDDEHYPTAKAVFDLVGQSGSSAETAKAYYSTFTGAVTDLNAGTTDNADATRENAACYLSKDSDGNTCLVLLSDVELIGDVEITVDVILNVNGHTVLFAGDYSLKFSGDRSILDCRVEGSRIEKTIDIAEGRVYTIDFAGAYGELLGGEISYSAASVSSDATKKSTPNVVVNNRNNRLVIDGCQISAEFGGGDAAGKYIVVVSNECIVKNTNITGLAYGVTTEATKRTQMYCINLVQVGKSCHIENCSITAVSTYSGTYAYGIAALKNNSSGVLEIKNTSVHVDSLSSGGTGIYMLENTITSIINTTSFADGTTGSVAEGNENYAGTQGIINYGTMTLKNCSVYGTHTGIQCSGGSITKINGGLFEGTGHGGLYIACPNAGKFYAENATFRNVPYGGVHKNEFFYGNSQYMVAAVYVGGGNDIKAYMDNCILDGGGPEMIPDYSHEEVKYLGAEPIRFRHSSNEQRNSAFMSNCTLMGDGKIRFANSTHKLYLGFGNRVLCEPNLESCLDKTTYAGKVFTSWEE